MPTVERPAKGRGCVKTLATDDFGGAFPTVEKLNMARSNKTIFFTTKYFRVPHSLGRAASNRKHNFARRQGYGSSGKDD
jgi:hypothetical protein